MESSFPCIQRVLPLQSQLDRRLLVLMQRLRKHYGKARLPWILKHRQLRTVDEGRLQNPHSLFQAYVVSIIQTLINHEGNGLNAILQGDQVKLASHPHPVPGLAQVNIHAVLRDINQIESVGIRNPTILEILFAVKGSPHIQPCGWTAVLKDHALLSAIDPKSRPQSAHVEVK